MNSYTRSTVRCGIILAAGEDRGHPPVIRQRGEENIPNPYANFTGSRSLLERTLHRAEHLIPPERLFVVVGPRHLGLRDVGRQWAGRSKGTVIVQAENTETGPGLLLPLMLLTAWYPEAVVVVFPTDHLITEEELFMGYVDLACRAVERGASRLVLLGIEPNYAETEYGYILPGDRAENGTASCVRPVIRLIEKPDRAAAQTLIQAGALWNSFTMATRAATLLELVRQTTSVFHGDFYGIREAIGTAWEHGVADEVDRTMTPVNFYKDVLHAANEQRAVQLAVLPVRGVTWANRGPEGRSKADLQGMRAMDSFDRIRSGRTSKRTERPVRNGSD